MENRGSRGVIYTKGLVEKRGIGIENPFSFKVGQVFTGFGIGCGLGIGFGTPLNLGAIPVLNQVMVATRGATGAFSGVQRHFNNSVRKLGVNNIEAGIGCGVGFGHGFGVGLAVKPSIINQIHSRVLEAFIGVSAKFGMSSSSSAENGIVSASLQTGMGMVEKPVHVNAEKDSSQSGKSILDGTYDGHTGGQKSIFSSTKHGRQTDAVPDNFLKSPLVIEESSVGERAGASEMENNLLQMVLKHQLLIEDLIQENEKLRRILMEELKVPQKKFQSSSTSWSRSVCSECFECRRKQRRR